MAARPSTPLRRAGSFLALLAFEIGAVVLLTRLGRVPALRIPWHSLTPWLLNSPVEDVLAAILRMIALLIAWWLLGSNLLYLLASLTRVHGAVRAVRWCTLPVVRTVTDHAVALTLATSLVSGGTGATIAAATPVVAAAPQRSGPVAAGQGGPRAGAIGPAGYLPQPAGAREAAEGGLAQQPGQGQGGYVPTPAGPPSRPGPSSSSSSSTSSTSTTAPPPTTSGAPSTTGYRPIPAGPPSSAGRPTTSTGGATSTSGSTTSTTRPPASTGGSTTSTSGTTTSTGGTSTSTTKPPASTRPGGGGGGGASPAPTSSSTTSTTTPGPVPTPVPTPTPIPAPAPAPTPRPTPSPPPGQREEGAVHHVVQGENLWVIARNRLARVTERPAGELSDHEIAAYWLRVIAANRGSLQSGDPDLIFPGESIKLPPVAG